ncbi:MAG: ribonuclease PH [Verrucomicrobia bacterium]|nr:ribonuclease PH [Verrucomicrobiota bacterium]
MRDDGRASDQLRPLRIVKDIAPYADGSVLIATGDTQIICAATVENSIPKWMKEQGVTGGWITAEYSMLPYSTLVRKQRDIAKGKMDGRSVEIQRLIGRALRTTIDLNVLEEKTVWIDCDVLQADGGTRTAAITGASLALARACVKLLNQGRLKLWPLRQLVAAVSVGVVEGQVLLDLNYKEDKDAAIDLNLVMTSTGSFVELQGAGEEATFSQSELQQMIDLGRKGIEELIGKQRQFLLEASQGSSEIFKEL